VSGLATPALLEDDQADRPVAQEGTTEENTDDELERELTRVALEKFGSKDNGIGIAKLIDPKKIGRR
jgi:hypothetical protein